MSLAPVIGEPRAPWGLPGATAATRYVGATAAGAPASGTFAVGDFSVDQTGEIWVCTVAGSPGTWSNATTTGGVSNAAGTAIASGTGGVSGDTTIATNNVVRMTVGFTGTTTFTGPLSQTAPLHIYEQASDTTTEVLRFTNIAPIGSKAAAVYLYGTNGPAPNGGAWSMGIDTAAATPYRDFYLARWNSDDTVTDLFYISYDNGNGHPVVGIGWVVPPTDAVLNISANDADAAMGGIKIRHLTAKTAYPFRVVASADNSIRQAFNDKGGVMVGGDYNNQGASGGVQFLATNTGVADSSLWLEATHRLTTDALFRHSSSLTALLGTQYGVSSAFPLIIEHGFSSNDDGWIGHNVNRVGAGVNWFTTGATFGSRAIQFNGSNGASGGIFFYADAASATGGGAATVTLRLTIQNDGTLVIADAGNIKVGTTTGTKIGTATTQKIGFFNATPVVQQSGVGSATGYAAGSTGATFHSDDTYTGNVGSTAYTLNGIVAALKNLGLIAA